MFYPDKIKETIIPNSKTFDKYLYHVASNKNTGKQCILYSNRVLEHKVKFKTEIKKGLETNSCPYNRKNSPDYLGFAPMLVLALTYVS